MALKGTVLAGLAALMLSAPVADAKLTNVEVSHLSPVGQLGVKGCTRRAEKGDIMAVHLKLKIDAESPEGEKGLFIGDSRAEDQGRPHTFKLGAKGGILPALNQALEGACGGETLRVRIPSAEAYGKKGMGIVPGDADIEFEADVVDVVPADQVEKLEKDNKQPEYVKIVYRDDKYNRPGCEYGTEAVCGASRPPRNFRPNHVVNDFVTATSDNGRFEGSKAFPINYFATMDENQDNWVSEEEYKAFTKKLGLKWSFWKLVFLGDDKDKDGRLSWDEFSSPKGTKKP